MVYIVGLGSCTLLSLFPHLVGTRAAHRHFANMLQVFLSFPNHPLYFIAAQTGEELHLDRGQYLLAGTTCPQQSDKPDGGGAGIVRVYAVVKGTHAQGL